MVIKVSDETRICTPQTVYDILSSVLAAEDEIDQDKEHFWVIGLTTRNTVRYLDLVSLGTLSSSLVHPREVFRTAIGRGVASLVLSHNHPSGDPEPSDDDIKLTRRLAEAGRIIGIEILDHVIVGSDERHASLKEQNLV